MIDTCIGADRKREFDVFCNLQTTFLEDLTAAGFPPEIHHRRAVHAPAFRPRGLEHAQGERQVGADLPEGALLFGRKEWDHWKHLRDTDGYHDMEHLKDSIDPVMEAGLVRVHRVRTSSSPTRCR